MRRIVVLAVAVLLAALVAEARAATTLERPVAVELIRGDSAMSEADAVTALNADDDSDYDVTNELRRDVYSVVYLVRFQLDERPKTLTLQLNASTALSFGCSLGLDLYRWDAGSWSKRSVGAVSSTEEIHTRPEHRAKGFVKRGKVLGRIRCTNSAGFGVLSSDTVRLVADSP